MGVIESEIPLSSRKHRSERHHSGRRHSSQAFDSCTSISILQRHFLESATSLGRTYNSLAISKRNTSHRVTAVPDGCCPSGARIQQLSLATLYLSPALGLSAHATSIVEAIISVHPCVVTPVELIATTPVERSLVLAAVERPARQTATGRMIAFAESALAQLCLGLTRTGPVCRTILRPVLSTALPRLSNGGSL